MIGVGWFVGALCACAIVTFISTALLCAGKIEELERQLYEKCNGCDYYEKYLAAKADADAAIADFKKLERRNWQLLSENRRLLSKAWRAA